MAGYIPISRQLFEHPFWIEEREFSRAEAWIDLLRSVRFEANSTKVIIGNKAITIQRGEYPASLRFLAKRWKWSKNKVDNFLNLLMDEKMIEKRTAEGTMQTIVRICNYDTYNLICDKEGQQEGRKKDTKGTVEGQLRDKSNKDNKENNINEERSSKDDPKINAPDVATRKQGFYNSLVPFSDKYPKEMLRAFYDYWSELNRSGKKMRFEMQKTWETPKRLSTWANKEPVLKKQVQLSPEKLSKTQQMLLNAQKLMRKNE